MTDPAKPPRRWFRFHLSTAILSMLLSGAIIGANLSADTHSSRAYQQYGWPVPVYKVVNNDGKSVISAAIGTGKWPPVPLSTWNYPGIPIDAGLAAGILLAFAFAFEWFIRREAKPSWPNRLKAVLLFLLAAALIGANLRDRKSEKDSLEGRYGWPLIAKEYAWNEASWRPGQFPPPEFYSEWFPISVAMDFLAAIAILLSVLFSSKWLIRRREGRKR